MLQRLRHRAQGQEGFTLIELLVVILIIGILAAVAIPTFLSQTNKAKDSNAQAVLSTVQTTEATYQSSNNAYAGPLTASQTSASASGSGNNAVAANPLIAIEPTLGNPWGTYNMTVTLNGTTGYTATATSPQAESGSNYVLYSLTYNNSTGAVTKSCYLVASGSTTNAGSAANVGGCNNSSSW